MASTRRLAKWVDVALLCACGLGGTAQADPVAYVVNADSNSVSVVDINAQTTRENLSTWDGSAPNVGREPKDVAVDSKSGRAYVATRGRLVHFDTRGPNPMQPRFVASQWDEGSGIAIDEPGRRVFMSHEQSAGESFGVVSEFSISDPVNPVLLAEHQIAGVPDLRFIAYDAYNRRLYVVAENGTVVSTGYGNLSFFALGGTGAPGGMIADPSGGIWLTNRVPGKLVRILDNSTRTEWPIAGAQNPRGLARETSGSILIAVEDLALVKRFTPATGAFTNAMMTDMRPQDAGVTSTGAVVSANRIASSMNGSVTKNGMFAATTQVKSIAMTVLEMLRLTPDPASHGFCWNRTGDTSEKTFSVRNTRSDRVTMNMGSVAIGGQNPINYAIVSNGCNAARLNYGDTCQFRLRFTASGASNQPTNPFVTYQIPRWPAEATLSSTDNSATARITLSGALYVNPCNPLPPLIPLPRPTFGGF